MTELLTRPSTRSRYDDDVADGAPSLWWRGSLAAVWVVAVGTASLVVIVLVAWAADARSGAGATSAIRTALQIWLAAHRVPLRLPYGSIGVAPLGLTAVLAFLVARAAAVLARGHGVDSPAGVGLTSLAVGVPYAALATFVAAAASSSTVRPNPVVALLGGLVLGCLAAGWGAARGTGLVGACWHVLPEWLRVPAGAGAAALGVMLAAAAVLLCVSVGVHAADAARMVDGLGGGVVAMVAVVALDVVLVPNAVMCALGYVAGPGFAVGAGTSVSLADVHTGALPALPLLAALPRRPAGVLVEVGVIAVLVAGGILAAWLVARAGEALTRTMALAAGAGAVAGLFAAVLAAVAGGPAGPGRMTALGPSAWQTGLAVAGEVAVVACGAAGVLTWRRGR